MGECFVEGETAAGIKPGTSYLTDKWVANKLKLVPTNQKLTLSSWEMIAPLSPRPGVQSLHYYRDRPTFDLFKEHHNEAPHLATPCIMVFSTSMIPP